MKGDWEACCVVWSFKVCSEPEELDSVAAAATGARLDCGDIDSVAAVAAD